MTFLAIKAQQPQDRPDQSGAVERTGPDTLFDEARNRLGDFSFDAKTVSVFDDIVSRSVPFYDEMQRMTGEIARDFAESGSAVFDLGCSTANTLLRLDHILPRGVRFMGVDNSADMLERARQKLKAHPAGRRIDLVQADLHHEAVVEDASVVVMILSLQFMRPQYRERVMHWVFKGMRENGALVLIEKLTVGDSLLNRLFIQYYYDLKRHRDYSELEISRKREALENVLIPYRWEENRDLLSWTGFRHVETFFRWYNFAGMLAVR